MAFENVFGNVNYGMIPQARQQEASRLQQMIGQGIAMGERAQDRDIKSRQLEMDAAEKEAFKINELGPQAMYRIALDPANATLEDKALAQTYQLSKAAEYNPQTGETAPTRLAQLMGGQQGLTQNQYGGDYNASVDQQAPLMAQEQMLGARGGASPKTQQKVQEAQVTLDKETISGAIKEKQKIEEEMRKARRPEFEPMDDVTPSPDDTKIMSKVLVSRKMLMPLIKEYKDAVEKHGVSVLGSEGEKKLSRIGGRIKMQVKNLEELGALQQPDIEAMDAMMGSAILSPRDIVNPISGFTQMKQGKQIAIDSMDEFGAYVDNIAQSQADVRGFKLKDSPQKAKKDKTKLTPEQARAELARRRGQ